MSSVQTTDVGFRKLAVSNKMYICEFCGTVLKSRSGFRRHLLHHNGGEPHKCTICGKSFIDKEHFLGHINGHRGVEPYICTICKKTFTYRRSLLRHRAYCKGNAVILHRCKTCCKTFGKKETLRDHIKGQHSDFGKVYACSVCGKRFKWRGSRSKHINTKHGHFFWFVSISPFLSWVVHSFTVLFRIVISYNSFSYICSFCRFYYVIIIHDNPNPSHFFRISLGKILNNWHHA